MVKRFKDYLRELKYGEGDKISPNVTVAKPYAEQDPIGDLISRTKDIPEPEKKPFKPLSGSTNPKSPMNTNSGKVSRPLSGSTNPKSPMNQK